MYNSSEINKTKEYWNLMMIYIYIIKTKETVKLIKKGYNIIFMIIIIIHTATTVDIVVFCILA